MRRSRPLALLAPVALIAAIGAFAIALPASGASGDTLTAEAPPVGPFSRVEVSGHAHVVLVQGEKEAVTVEASPKAGARVRVRSSNGRLVIDTHDGERGINLFGGGRAPTVTIYFRQLEEIELSGAVKVRAEALRADVLRIDASGAATVEIEQLQVRALVFEASGAIKAELAGTATEQETSISGAAVYRADKLKSQSASISVSGAGKAIVNAERKLDAKITGAGVVEYIGDPAVTQRVSGAGKITRRAASDDTATKRAA
jgi:hypothetical protein